MISNCGTPTEKVSEFLDNHLQPIMRKGFLILRILLILLIKDINNAILVTADDVTAYPSIPHDVGLKALREVLDK